MPLSVPWLAAWALRLPLTRGLTEPPPVGLGTGYTDCYGDQLDCAVPGDDFFEAALEAGCRLFDTATVYGTEAPLGRALRRWFARGHLREEVYLISKPPATKHLW